ncbi:hypothetical protein GGX14DRAFT_585515 [Mycena pura]|uniref:F-box domain-containing protein n=1 Tax=Mycena pura TaxID=153505 RepID=A0AAD6VRM0_9AGAR|nr:hypothetical protein GGX14DRAFT_585515 [Mycena pura]
MDCCPFPLEVVDIIIHQLHFDLAALKACSLVCRSWLPSCRTQLFRHLELHPTGRASPANLYRFLSDAPQIAPYIKELDVPCERSSWISWDTVLPALLGWLQNVEQIELRGCDIPWLPAPLTAAIYTLFRSPCMKRVSLRLCVLPSSCSDLFGSALESIELSDVTIETDASAHVAKECRAPRPRRVMIEGKAIGSVVDWLVPSAEDLQDLCVRYQGDDSDAQQAIERLLQCASSLKTLDISLYPACLRECLRPTLIHHHATLTIRFPESTSGLCAAPSICYNHDLQQLRLLHFDMDVSSPTNQLPWLYSLLSRLTTQHLIQKISIDARHRPRRLCTGPPMLDTHGWSDVDALLARTAPAHLREVHVQIGDPYDAATLARVAASMPELRAKGILRVTM